MSKKNTSHLENHVDTLKARVAELEAQQAQPDKPLAPRPMGMTDLYMTPETPVPDLSALMVEHGVTVERILDEGWCAHQGEYISDPHGFGLTPLAAVQDLIAKLDEARGE